MSVILTDVAPWSSDERLLKGFRQLACRLTGATPTAALAIRKTATPIARLTIASTLRRRRHDTTQRVSVEIQNDLPRELPVRHQPQRILIGNQRRNPLDQRMQTMRSDERQH